MPKKSYNAFSVIGIEIEYMIVDRDSLNILPLADQLILKMAGKLTNEFEAGHIAISNELALHVIELKTNGPTPSLHDVEGDFFQVVKEINQALSAWRAMLLPSGMHPWYMPTEGFLLWPHGDRSIYQAYHRIFDCHGHGWANLQSMHLNLPFGNESEFVELHTVVRLLLPFIPALTASTPFCEGRVTEVQDTRLLYYGKNQRRIPSISGQIIPEFVSSYDDYHETILNPMFRDIAPHDESNCLQDEWLNSRGAIARFDRNAIEIRVIDSQECVAADLACARFISLVLRDLVSLIIQYQESALPEVVLRQQYDFCIKMGMQAEIVDSAILSPFYGVNPQIRHVNELWCYFFERVRSQLEPDYCAVIEVILEKGNLASRLRAASGDQPDHVTLQAIYRELSHCLHQNRLFGI